MIKSCYIWEHHRLRYFLLCCILVGFVLAAPVSGVRVFGSKYEDTVSPGQIAFHEVNLSLGAHEPATDLLIEVAGMGNSIDGGLIAILANEDISPYSARSFITLNNYSIHLEPGSFVVVKATIKIPADVKEGGRYAMITIHTPPKGEGAVAFVTAVNVPIALTIKGAKTSKTGSITDISISEAMKGKASAVSTILQNTGNYYYVNPICDIRLTDSSGKLLLNSTKDPEGLALIPTYSARFSIPITTKLDPGNYVVLSKVFLSDHKTLLAEKTQTVELKKPYVPPFEEVDITLSPGAAAVLTTADDTKYVSFQAGSVFDATRIAMRPVPVDSIPSAPTNTKLGDTVFSVEGLSGLLSKDATVTVKYSQLDLETAGGNPQKLVIARYDKLENQWVFMPTDLDTTAGTLTTKTNRLSIWAVMAMEGQVPRPGETAVPGTTTTKTPGFTVGIAFGALAVLFIVDRWRKR